jgi:uncharacterized membrane protein YfcA
MVMFALLMLIVSIRMWQQSRKNEPVHRILSDNTEIYDDTNACQRDSQGRLKLNTRCALLLIGLGIFVGIQTGLFGVGGGFLIVPALVLFSGIPILHAVGTSLLVISMVSMSGIASQLYSGRTVSLEITSLFIVGGIMGLFVGQYIGKRLSASMLQKIFSVAILFVAIFVLLRNFST